MYAYIRTAHIQHLRMYVCTYILYLYAYKCSYLSHVHVHYIQTIFSAGDAANVAGVLEVFASYRQKKDACSRMEKVGLSSAALSSRTYVDRNSDNLSLQ